MTYIHNLKSSKLKVESKTRPQYPFLEQKRKSTYLLSLRQVDPELSPRRELLLIAEIVLHLLGSIAGAERRPVVAELGILYFYRGVDRKHFVLN